MPSLARVGSLSCPFPGAGSGHSLGLQAAPWLSPLSLGKVFAARGTEEVGLWSPRAPGREGLGMPVQPWISRLDPIIRHQSGQWIICSRILRFLALPLLPLSPLSLLRLLAVWVALGLENAGRWLKSSQERADALQRHCARQASLALHLPTLQREELSSSLPSSGLF